MYFCMNYEGWCVRQTCNYRRHCWGISDLHFNNTIGKSRKVCITIIVIVVIIIVIIIIMTTTVMLGHKDTIKYILWDLLLLIVRQWGLHVRSPPGNMHISFTQRAHVFLWKWLDIWEKLGNISVSQKLLSSHQLFSLIKDILQIAYKKNSNFISNN
jgi:hypothetical protein